MSDLTIKDKNYSFVPKSISNQVKSIVTMFQIRGLNENYIDLISMNKQLEIEKLSINKYDEMLSNKSKNKFHS